MCRMPRLHVGRSLLYPAWADGTEKATDRDKQVDACIPRYSAFLPALLK
jgi:hypothetical protein